MVCPLLLGNARWIVTGRNRGLSPVGDVLLSVVWLVILLFYRLEIDIHAAFWQLGVP